MAESIRERVARHREHARFNGLVRVDVELPQSLLHLRRSDETVKDLIIRALTALLPPNSPARRDVLPETLPETQPPAPTVKKLPETLPETKLLSPEEARFIALWEAGVEVKAIAAALEITWTAAQSRAHRLQRQGLIQPRPRGGDYPNRRAQARQRPETP
jgi:hypothetical protein